MKDQRTVLQDDLNPGIRRVVALLNAAGFLTCDSGDGATHDHPCDRPGGYVVVRLQPWAELKAACHAVESLLNRHMRSDAGWPNINGTYDPRDQLSFIDISPITDADLVPEGVASFYDPE